MRWKALWTARSSMKSARHEAAEEALQAAGASRRAAALLTAAGYTSAEGFLKAPWTALDAGGQYQSAEWRISVQPDCTPAGLEEVRKFRERLTGQSAPEARPR